MKGSDFGRRPRGVSIEEWELAHTVRDRAKIRKVQSRVVKTRKISAAAKLPREVGELETFARTFFEQLGRDGRMLIHEYSNGDLDAELLWDLTRGQNVQDLFDLVQAAFEKPFPRGWFVQAGCRYALKKGDPTYKKVSGGLNELASYWQVANRANVAEAILILQEKIGPNAQRRFRRKPVNVFLRVRHSDDRPQRDTRTQRGKLRK